MADGCESGHNQEGKSTARRVPTRRDALCAGARLAFVPPILSTFLAREAYAVNYSCYGAGHACGGATNESCCGTLTCIANICQ